MTEIAPKKFLDGSIIHFFTSEDPVPQYLIEAYSRLYMKGFNNPPWDIYEYDITPVSALNEFNILLNISLKSGGALISLEDRSVPAGFGIIANMHMFISRLSRIKKIRHLPVKYVDPESYFHTLAEKISMPLDRFNRIGYLADSVVGHQFRGRGYGTEILIASIDYLGMAHLLEEFGFSRISGIGDRGEGIDILVQGKAWYPTLVVPAKDKISVNRPAKAEHYIKFLK
jgi:hypothetical protein